MAQLVLASRECVVIGAISRGCVVIGATIVAQEMYFCLPFRDKCHGQGVVGGGG